ncbi:enoyl-CoA hydratase/isomerase family protein [Streptomyces sp. NBC_00385]|uniref:enoyl-CoA hydratase/isomerase family protein n=1 Tax=Streptomyces sp. NBC_00385 TaxID=2975733 RepID=UPI002DDA6243|nr:enoyl-CoA hydratase-related protein [Streptomyces sp. NBC_00385]WRZ01986.1 enoyl-CoA hydratase-related protein [Streptomyces sp. NBC_00385]
MTGEPVLLTCDSGGVRTLVLNRPHRRNALDAELWEALRSALVDAGADRSVRALVLTGAGDAFCSGADLPKRPSTAHPLHRMRTLTEVTLLLHELPMPTVAKVTGVAVGAGWNLALGCDLVIAVPEARFSQIFARRGLSPDCGGTWILPRLVGLQQAKRLALLAETIDAGEALSRGLVTWVVAAADVDAFTDDVTARLAAGPPVALAQTKALLNENTDRTLREALAGEARAQAVNFATADAPEAYAAFAEKREARFTGRWAVPTRTEDDA